MSLVWHIAKKDLRRMAPAVGVWLALVAGPTLVLRIASPAIHGHPGSDLDAWRWGLAIWMRLLEGMQIVIGCVLAGSLVLEDPLVGTTGFWTTRPVAGGRLLVAKILAALALFVVAPIGVLTPVWLSAGFGAVDLVQAGWEFTARLGAVVLFALMVASCARNLAQFIFFTLLIAAAFAMTGLVPEPFWRPAPIAVRVSREWLVLGGALPAMAAVLAHQYLTRRVARTWGLMAGALLLATVIRCAWPWDIRSGTMARAPHADDRVADVVTAPAFTQHSPKSVPSLYGRTTWRPERFLVPVYARTAEGAPVMRSGGMWEREAGLHLLGFQEAAAPVRWQLHRLSWQPARRKADEPEFKGLLEVWAVRPRVLGEMPVRVGEEMMHGATRVRILRLVSNDGRLDNIFIEERDAHARAAAGWSRNWSPQDGGRERHVDRYFIVHRAARQATDASPGEIGSVEANSLVVTLRNLAVSWPHDLAGAVLVKVRFECEQRVAVPLVVTGVSSRGFDQVP